MFVVNWVEEVRDFVSERRIKGELVGFVPTMGALHEGHLSLVKIAREHCDHVVMSVFVNAPQFNSAEDLKKYPKELERDVSLAKESGVDLLFAPSEEEMYPGGVLTLLQGGTRCSLIAGNLSSGLCGGSRPGHFDGVVTVVAILFNIVRPDVAVFGEKDYQQLRVLEQLNQDLHFNINIVPAPIVREKDGLAMSSRNAVLTPENRESACLISQALFMARDKVLAGERLASSLLKQVVSHIESDNRLEVDYAEIVDVDTLKPVSEIQEKARILVAAYAGSVRLIDNVLLHS